MLKPALGGITEMFWQELTAFQDWHKWMPGAREVIQLDEGAIARGSTLRVHAHNIERVWTVSRWDPPRRIEFIVDSAIRQRAYGFSLQADSKNSELVIVLDVERTLRGPQRLFAPLLSALQRRHCQKLLNGFVENLQTP